MDNTQSDRKFKGLLKALHPLFQLSVLGSAVPIAFGTIVSTFLYFRYRDDIESLQNQYHLEQDSKAKNQSQQVQTMFQQVHQGLQTIANFPGVRRIDTSHANFRPKETDWGSDAYEGIIQIYRKLSEDFDVSEIHIASVHLDPDVVNPITGKKWGPVATFDQNSLSPKNGTSDFDSNQGEDDLFELQQMKEQLGFFKTNWPDKSQVKLLNYPALMSPQGAICDDRFFKKTSDQNDRQGFVYSVPFYGQDGELRGIVSCVFLNHVIRGLITSSDSAIVNTKSHLVIKRDNLGTAATSPESAKLALPDPDLFYSTVSPVNVPDLWGRWHLWTGKTASDFWERDDVHVLRTTMFIGVGILWLGIAALVAVMTTVRRRQDQKLESLLRSSQEILFMTDENGDIVRVGGQIKKALGWDASDFIGVNLSLFVIETSRQAFSEHLKRVTERKYGTESCEFEIETHENDYVWYELTTTNMSHLPEIGGVIVSFKNVETRKHAEFMLRTAKDAAESANEAKSEFLSRMSHELRTPLNAILGFGQLLEMNAETTKDQESVEQILKAGHHLLTLVNDILDISRIESGNLTMSVEPVDCNDVLSTAISFVRSLAEQAGVLLQVTCPEDLKVVADRQRVIQVIVNLLSNAIKYNRKDGFVTINVTNNGQETSIEIVDTGIGIDPHEIDRLFTPFDRLGAEKLAIEGTGLGLALSKTLVEAMGGRIEVRSVPDVGTTMELILRSPAPKLELVEGSGEDIDRDYGRTMKVLYIEDNLANVKVMEEFFAMISGFELEIARQGGIGIELIDTYKPNIILLDLHLTDMSGMDVLEHIRNSSECTQTKVIILSAEGNPAQLEHALIMGADYIFSKPIDLKNLLASLHGIAEAA